MAWRATSQGDDNEKGVYILIQWKTDVLRLKGEHHGKLIFGNDCQTNHSFSQKKTRTLHRLSRRIFRSTKGTKRKTELGGYQHLLPKGQGRRGKNWDTTGLRGRASQGQRKTQRRWRTSSGEKLLENPCFAGAKKGESGNPAKRILIGTRPTKEDGLRAPTHDQKRQRNGHNSKELTH